MVPAGKWVNVGFEPKADPDRPAPFCPESRRVSAAGPRPPSTREGARLGAQLKFWGSV
jgi:hypothetical protein